MKDFKKPKKIKDSDFAALVIVPMFIIFLVLVAVFKIKQKENTEPVNLELEYIKKCCKQHSRYDVVSMGHKPYLKCDNYCSTQK